MLEIDLPWPPTASIYPLLKPHAKEKPFYTSLQFTEKSSKHPNSMKMYHE